ncbi:hypothetical protein PAXRUDRAFT_172141 [Paxillus rubicundulus Ve08.2h10]|uniref:Uncharacterized protein n=1 Tax=Paxillus rubicundulus Ve08.2h10 TaxID=930991 RepID=A0A0D0DDX1_9AGAM|nr:hypothetical protein PAXRUDRAFT_172141 [Paxillus rubicundulus Ve08.2h10]
MITLDNASNCNTMMRDVEAILKDKGIAFDSKGNRIRYNLDYLDALRGDVVSAARQVVTACRASGQRCEDLSKVIKEGYELGDWTKEDLRDVTLLHDVVTCWSSIFLMVNRLLELYLAISRLFQQDKYEDLRKHELSHIQLQVLADIRLYLAFFHVVQEEVSAQKTPTLSIVLPLYEKLIHHLGLAKDKLPCIAHSIEDSIGKLNEYLVESWKTQIYALAIILNPTLKFSWIDEHWLEEDARAAHSWVCSSVHRLLLCLGLLCID